MITVISSQDIVSINEEILGIKTDETRQEKVQSCLSYYLYYDTLEMQIASIVSLLIIFTVSLVLGT